MLCDQNIRLCTRRRQLHFRVSNFFNFLFCLFLDLRLTVNLMILIESKNRLSRQHATRKIIYFHPIVVEPTNQQPTWDRRASLEKANFIFWHETRQRERLIRKTRSRLLVKWIITRARTFLKREIARNQMYSANATWMREQDRIWMLNPHSAFFIISFDIWLLLFHWILLQE